MDNNNPNKFDDFEFLKLIYKEFIVFLKEIKEILKKKETILIWVCILPFNIIITIVNIVIGITNYINLIIKYIFKSLKKKLKYKNIKPIKINKKNIIFKNYFLQTLYFLTIDLSIKKSFILFYNQLYFLKNIKKENKNIKNKIKKIFEIIVFIIFRKIIFYITSLPFFILKNNNEVTFLINDINEMNCKTFDVYFSTLCANLIKDFNLISNLETKKLKIKFNKKNIYLNPTKQLDIIEKLNNIKKLTYGTTKLIKGGRIATMRYNLEKKIIKAHPSLLYNSIDTHESNKPTYMIINQSTKRYLNTGKEIKEDFLIKNKIENELQVRGIINTELTAFNVTPHIIHKELTEIINSKKLIYNWGQKENWIKQFNFVQSFLINMENSLLKVDKKHGIIIDPDYKSIRDYIDKNYLFFTKNVQEGLENIIDFYEKNKIIFENRDNKLNFIKCLWLAEIDPEVKNLFKNIIEKNI